MEKLPDNIRIYNEIGIGNQWFSCHEIEQGENETRVKGFAKINRDDIYLRLWIGKRVWILSRRNGLVRMCKNRNSFKLLLGFSGTPK